MIMNKNFINTANDVKVEKRVVPNDKSQNKQIKSIKSNKDSTNTSTANNGKSKVSISNSIIKERNSFCSNSNNSISISNYNYVCNNLGDESIRTNFNTNNTNSNIKFNPWEDSTNFVQDVGELGHFLSFLERNQINEIKINQNVDNFESGKTSLNLLKTLEDISRLHFEQIKELEYLYEKYRNESVLSINKNWALCDSIQYLSDTLKKFENNKIKIATLLHNTSLSENNLIKIKHCKKPDLLKTLKVVLNKVNEEENRLQLINLSFNMHKENINKLSSKYEEVQNQIDYLINDLEVFTEEVKIDD